MKMRYIVEDAINLKIKNHDNLYIWSLNKVDQRFRFHRSYSYNDTDSLFKLCMIKVISSNKRFNSSSGNH